MTDLWDAAPSQARWYGFVIFEDEDGETEYHEAFSAAEDQPDPRKLAPEGARILENEVTRIQDKPEDDPYPPIPGEWRKG